MRSWNILLRHLLTPLLYVTKRVQVVRINNALVDMLGYSTEEVVSQSLNDHMISGYI